MDMNIRPLKLGAVRYADDPTDQWVIAEPGTQSYQNIQCKGLATEILTREGWGVIVQETTDA